MFLLFLLLLLSAVLQIVFDVRYLEVAYSLMLYFLSSVCSEIQLLFAICARMALAVPGLNSW